jgi:hypothetical protein
MPFIKQEKRAWVEAGGTSEPGDRCYRYYKQMKQKWKENPRWTTAHEIYKGVTLDAMEGWEEELSRDLAWQVFFQLEVLPYELRKREENGDVE